jgi:creatinine amidohydrolase
MLTIKLFDMKKQILWTLLIVPFALAAQVAESAQKVLPVKWEELTSPDFITAVERSARTCVIPMGILEKHGPHLPLGTDLIDVRETAIRAAEKEYVIIFPPFYFGQIYEARQQPGTVAYSPRTVLTVLQETCDELYRNGIEKIILVNGHGGNNSLLPYFCQIQLEKQKDYAVYLFSPEDSEEFQDQLDKMRQTDWDGHAGETETSVMLANRPDLVHLDRANSQSGKDLQRLNTIKYAYTAIWWYAQFPNHYAGDGSYGTFEMGKLILDNEVDQLVEMIRSVKADQKTIELQNQFYEDSEHPLETGQ